MHLTEVFERGMAEMDPYARRFPWESAAAYALWLGQTHYFSRMTTRMLSLAGSLFELGEQALHERFLTHAREERGHEAILLDDLRHLGRTIDEIPELPVTSAFYQVQYYWMQHKRPVSLFGYILLLEGMAVHHGGTVYPRILASHGPNATKFFKVHTQSDPQHVREAIALVAGLSSDDADLIARDFEISSHLYRGILTDIEARAQSATSDAA
jgi:hypothetical protein